MLKLFKINKTGVSELMKSGEMQAILRGKAKEIASRCGSGYGTDIYIGKTRANASVGAITKKAKRDNYKNNTLLKAVK
ncbi:hypothetical protein [uncultured Parvimonas sp.]|uniref:hypothetical protein n=1 Tax=uncultured Parvimonas sp. TaxID=747372 RepID=UPI00325FDB7F